MSQFRFFFENPGSYGCGETQPPFPIHYFTKAWIHPAGTPSQNEQTFPFSAFDLAGNAEQYS